jgi:hypothetical protein
MNTKDAIRIVESAIASTEKQLKDGGISQGNYAYMKRKDLEKLKELLEVLSQPAPTFIQRLRSKMAGVTRLFAAKRTPANQ